MSGGYEWAVRPPNLKEKIVAAVFLALMLAATANSYAGWRWFGGYDKQVLSGLLFVGLMLIYFMPPIERR